MIHMHTCPVDRVSVGYKCTVRRRGESPCCTSPRYIAIVPGQLPAMNTARNGPQRTSSMASLRLPIAIVSRIVKLGCARVHTCAATLK